MLGFADEPKVSYRRRWLYAGAPKKRDRVGAGSGRKPKTAKYSAEVHAMHAALGGTVSHAEIKAALRRLKAEGI